MVRLKPGISKRQFFKEITNLSKNKAAETNIKGQAAVILAKDIEISILQQMFFDCIIPASIKARTRK